MLNSNEIRQLLSELRLEGAFIQKITEHDYHSFTLSMFSKTEKAFLLYFEVGTANQHFCRTEVMRKKSARTQRFTQYLKANITGSRIVSVSQVPGERVVCLTLSHNDETRKLFFRFFSGPGANIIVTDSGNIILELLMRRPLRGEEKGRLYTEEVGRAWDEERFPVRPWSGSSFNEYLDRYYLEQEKAEKTEDAAEALKNQRDRELASIRAQIRDARAREEHSRDYAALKETADILSSFSYMAVQGQSSIRVTDFSGSPVTIILDPSLSVSGNINAYYQKYKRQERINRNALQEIKELEARLEERTLYYENLLSQDSLQAMQKAVKKQPEAQRKAEAGPGLRFTSSGFEIIVGRNAKENDEILRRTARSNDTWLHTRDFAGGYVIIRGKKDKSIPLDVLLDAGNLAVHYSKAKGQGKADLYYTAVKHLRRIKDGKQGLVTPTQEKNLCITVDENRLRRLLLSKEERKC